MTLALAALGLCCVVAAVVTMLAVIGVTPATTRPDLSPVDFRGIA